MRKTETKEYILYYFICIKLKNKVKLINDIKSGKQ